MDFFSEESALQAFAWALTARENECPAAQIDPTFSRCLLRDFVEHPLFTSSTPSLLLDEIRKQAPRQVCQYAFRKNDIVWICKTCQKDETCVLCNACFNDSEHTGHEVYFYHSQAGGCCDCGDPDAWDPNGFCSKHGHVIQNPIEHVPPLSRKMGLTMMNTLAEYIAQFCSDFVRLFDNFERADLTVQSVAENVMLVLHSADVHPLQSIIRSLVEIGLSREEVANATSAMHFEGCFRWKELPLQVAKEKAMTLRTQGLLVCIMLSREEEQEKKITAIISWLYKVAQASDGLCRIVCNALTVDRLRRIMLADCRLNKRVAKDLHDLFLTLMADQSFKMSVARAYAQSFEGFTKDYATGIGTQEMSLYNLSVQFLNRAAFVNEMVEHHTFLESLARSLRGILRQAYTEESGLDSSHEILGYRRYNPIIGDFKCVFSIPGVSRTFLACCLTEWLEVLELGQYMHPQTRQMTQHVEYESRDWMNAFNLYLGISSVFEYLVNWFGEGDAHEDVPLRQGVIAPSVQSILNAISSALYLWQKRFLDLSTDSWESNGYSEWPPPILQFSFHLFLHRFLAASIREAAKYPHHSEALHLVQQKISEHPLQLMTMLDLPLVNIVWATQIRLGMWKRNGQIMGDQVLNYAEPPFCRVFRDLDVTLVQFCALSQDSQTVMQHILERYGVQDYVINHRVGVLPDSQYIPALLEEVLVLLALIITELPPEPSHNPRERVIPLLRREIVHKLVGGSATYSQLQECLPLVPDHDKLSSDAIDEVLQSVAELKPGVGLEPSKYVLRESKWSLYEPSFPHIHTHAHQQAVENRPKLTKPGAMVPCPLAAHPLFRPLRPKLLFDTILIRLLRDLVVSCASNIPTVESQYSLPQTWEMQCSGTILIRVIHILTIQIHQLVSPDCDLELRNRFARFLMEDFAAAVDDDSSHANDSGMVEIDAAQTQSRRTPCMLTAILDVHDSLMKKEDADNRFWLRWILTHIKELSSECGEMVTLRLDLGTSVERGGGAAAMEMKKKKAKDRAMKAVKASAAAFAKKLADFNLSDDEEELNTNANTKKHGVSRAEEGAEVSDDERAEEPVCIICHDHSGEDLGYIALTQGSRLLCPREQHIHHPTTPETDDDDPSTNTQSCTVDVHLQFCGHAIHFSCFESYFVSVVAKSEQQNSLILDTNNREYTCPLCKSLANTIVPYTKEKKHRKRARQMGQTSADEELDVYPHPHPICLSTMEMNDLAARELRDWSASVWHSSEDVVSPGFRAMRVDTEDIADAVDAGTTDAASNTPVPTNETTLMDTMEQFAEEKFGPPSDMSSPHRTNVRRLSREKASDVDSGGVGLFRRLFRRTFARGAPAEGIQSPSVSSRELSLPDAHAPGVESPGTAAAEEFERRTKKWLDFAADVSAPRVGRGVSSRDKLGEYARTICSAVAFTVCLEEVEDSLAHHQAEPSNKREPLKLISTVVDALGETLREFGLLNDLCMCVLQKFQYGTSAWGHENDPQWAWVFSTPLLASNLLDTMVLVLAMRAAVVDEVVLNIAREICMLRLVQLCVRGVNVSRLDAQTQTLESKQDGGVNPNPNPNPSSSEDLQFNQGLTLIIERIQSLLHGGSLNTHALDQDDLMLRWIVFVRAMLQLLYRCRPQVLQTPIHSQQTPTHISFEARFSQPLAISWADMLAHAQLLRIPLPRTSDRNPNPNPNPNPDPDTAQGVYVSKLEGWMEDMYAHNAVDACVLAAGWHYPATCAPTLIILPDAYTKLHGELCSRCDYEYPAVCMVCGTILDAGGKGLCTKHVNKCSADAGVIFLLQDCSVLLLHGPRGSYFPAPYVDSHGERHRHFRGKPLYLDAKRYDMLRQLWASHGVAKEVILKRSSSNRVIINGHY